MFSPKQKLILASVGLVAIAAIFCLFYFRESASRNRRSAKVVRTLTKWEAARFISITNAESLENSTAFLLQRAEGRKLLSAVQKDSLQEEILRTYRAFSSGEFADYWAFRLPPDYDGQLIWNKMELRRYAKLLPSPELVQKALAENRISNPVRVAGYSLRTERDIFKYGWIALTDARTEKSHKRVYCSDVWSGISPENSKAWIGTKLGAASTMAAEEENAGVYRTPTDFIPAALAATNASPSLRCTLKLLIASTDFTPAYPVYIQYQYWVEHNFWVPIEFAAGCVIGRIDYIF